MESSALVVPEGLRPDEDFEVHRSWVAKIKEIRARGREEVSTPPCTNQRAPIDPYRFGSKSSGIGQARM